MCLAVFDIECFENKVMTELGVYKNGQILGYSFIPSKEFKTKSQFAWCTKSLHGINMNSGYENQIELKNKLRKLKTPEAAFSAKNYEKGKLLSEISETKIQERMTTHA